MPAVQQAQEHESGLGLVVRPYIGWHLKGDERRGVAPGAWPVILPK
ncbi:MAG TPA: hypothetical protein VKT21_01810 [Thermoplasmata archaeon]|nr:hypothetical protein [Thermoplasmata archaeon]